MNNNSDKLFTIVKYSHYFKITNLNTNLIPIINIFCNRYVVKGFARYNDNNKFNKYRKYEPPKPKIYGSFIDGINEFRFNINQFYPFINFIHDRHIKPSMYNLVEVPIYKPIEINCKLRPEWIKRDNQVPVINYMVKTNSPSVCATIRTGTGKTFCALCSTIELGYRTLILVKPAYIDKWVSDVEKTIDINIKDIMTVQGSNQLRGLIDLALNNKLNSPYIIISNKTLLAFINFYENEPDINTKNNYGCYPDELYEILGIGTIIIDEVHQDFHGLYRTFLYTNVKKTISLSATLTSNNWELDRMYKLLFPMQNRFTDLAVENYITCYAISYDIKELNRIRTTDIGSTFYSHNAFEKSILRYPPLLKSYKEMIKYIIDISYIHNYKRGDKLAIFASSVKMCTELTMYLKEIYRHLDVKRYVEDDPYSNVIDSDIRITTIMSGGTAIDIPGLTTVIQTINILSSQSNIQTLGRLRDIKDRKTEFYYLYCPQIPKHRIYHKQRKDFMNEYVKDIKELHYPKQV